MGKAQPKVTTAAREAVLASVKMPLLESLRHTYPVLKPVPIFQPITQLVPFTSKKVAVMKKRKQQRSDKQQT